MNELGRRSSPPVGRDLRRKLRRKPGHRPKSDKLAPEVLRMIEEGCSQRRIAKELNLSKTTVNEIVKRYRREVAETGSFIP
ncbi:MAG: helix-turn-helix domain-containing protein [Rubrobacter sp.]|nr:helix-turn-helix domain-containing protein [Rubrobacter sp.]